MALPDTKPEIELTRAQQRWKDPNYRAWSKAYQRKRLATEPEFRERLNELNRQSRARVKARKLAEAARKLAEAEDVPNPTEGSLQGSLNDQN